jgi:Mg2+/citrate symporter
LLSAIQNAISTASPLAAQTYLTTRAKLDSALVRYDAWFLVLIAIILALAAVLLGAWPCGAW